MKYHHSLHISLKIGWRLDYILFLAEQEKKEQIW